MSHSLCHILSDWIMDSTVFRLILIIVLALHVHLASTKSPKSIDDSDLFPVSIIHINDFHARFFHICFYLVFLTTFWLLFHDLNLFKFFYSNFCRFEETNEGATSCKQGEKCIGGYARAVTKIKELQKIRVNPIYLNAGDNFQGTLWYTFGRWNVTKQFLNMLNADATVSWTEIDPIWG